MPTIYGLNKTTLLDYPGHVAATIFLGRCNFRCPFCHNGGLVLTPELQPVIPAEEVFAFLEKRRGILTGVCISGGEPTLEPGLRNFIQRIKELGYLVKLDTNGYRPDVIRELLEDNLLDYIAMDIKNRMEKYGETSGIKGINTNEIRNSINCIQNSEIPYEFRTTIIKEFHTKDDICALAKELGEVKAYFLQEYKDSEQAIQQGFHAYEKKEMEEFIELIKPFVPNVALRGVS